MRPFRRLALLIAMLVLTACGEAYKVRPMRPEESAALSDAVTPLASHLGYLRGPQRCTFGVSLNDVPSRRLEVLPPRVAQECLGVSVTSGTLALPREELRALLAHGIAHLSLGHQSAMRVGAEGTRARARGFEQGRTYSTNEEREADREAAKLLTAAVPGRAACLALGQVLSRAETEAGRWSEWTEQHPLPRGRAAAARELCVVRR